MLDRSYYVYLLASRSRNLYTGVTNSLERRMIEHREGLVPGFTSKYKIFRLVHFEAFPDVRAAISREKEIKGWRRQKKIWLIQKTNPRWEDLAADFFAQRQRETQKYASVNPCPDGTKAARAQAKNKADPSPPSAKSAAGFGMTL